MLDRAGYSGALVQTDDLDAAIDGAVFVLFQIRVGGQAARLHDETVPLAAAASARRRPAQAASRRRCARCRCVLDIAERVAERAAPGAWIVDFTNPVGIVTRALLDAGHRAVGLCNVAIGFQRLFARLARRRAGARRRRPGRAQPPDVDSRGAARRPRRSARAARRARRRARGRDRAAAARARRARSDPVVLPALLLRARPRARGAAGRQSRARRPSPRSSASCCRCTAIRR